MKQLILFVAVLLASSLLYSPTANQAPREVRGKAAPQQYSPLLKGVDHFFAFSSEPETLFKFFRDTLGLPQVWDFKNFGDFASGGVWMGNVEFEVVTWKTACLASQKIEAIK